jgi:hypothetical protein
MTPLRVLVTGSRAWWLPGPVHQALYDTWHDITQVFGPDAPWTVVHGACPWGADRWAARWCAATGNTQEPHPADWSIGSAGGPARNRKMAKIGADLCLAFVCGPSRGTVNMIRQARLYGIPVVEHHWPYAIPEQRKTPRDTHIRPAAHPLRPHAPR